MRASTPRYRHDRPGERRTGRRNHRGGTERGAAGPVPKVPGSGQGLIGLTERATLAGGRFEHGPTDDGGFTVRAWLPWSA